MTTTQSGTKAINQPSSPRCQEWGELTWGYYIIEREFLPILPQESMRTYPHLPHFLFPPITTGSPRYPLRVFFFTQPLIPTLLISAPIWIIAHPFASLTNPSMGPSRLAPCHPWAPYIPILSLNFSFLSYSSKTLAMPWGHPCLSPVALSMEAFSTPYPRDFRALVPDFWPLLFLSLIRAPAITKHLSLRAISLYHLCPFTADILVTPLIYWAPGSHFPFPPYQCRHSQGLRHKRDLVTSLRCGNTRLPFILHLSTMQLRRGALGGLVWLFAWHYLTFSRSKTFLMKEATHWLTFWTSSLSHCGLGLWISLTKELYGHFYSFYIKYPEWSKSRDSIINKLSGKHVNSVLNFRDLSKITSNSMRITNKNK